MRELFNAVRYMVRTGCPWRLIPNDLPPWAAVYQQGQRWIKAGCFEAMAHDLRVVLRLIAGRKSEPTAVILDGRTMQSTPESGARAGYDGHKRRKGSKVHVAVDTLGHLLALKITPANEQERAQVGDLVKEIQETTGDAVEVAFVDQGYTGEQPAARCYIRLEVVKLEEAKRGFVLLPRRWVVERSFAWAQIPSPADYERLSASLAVFTRSAAHAQFLLPSKCMSFSALGDQVFDDARVVALQGFLGEAHGGAAFDVEAICGAVNRGAEGCAAVEVCEVDVRATFHQEADGFELAAPCGPMERRCVPYWPTSGALMSAPASR